MAPGLEREAAFEDFRQPPGEPQQAPLAVELTTPLGLFNHSQLRRAPEVKGEIILQTDVSSRCQMPTISSAQYLIFDKRS